MQSIVNLITTINTQAQTLLLVPVVVFALTVGGYHFIIGDHRGGRSWITGGLIGAAIVIGATSIAGLVRGGGVG